MAALIAVGVAWSAHTAWGAAQNSVAVSGPRQVDAGHRVRLHFTGHAAANVPKLRVWLDHRRCADTARAEGERADLKAPTDFKVRGNFRARLTVEHSSKGTHVVCAYLVHRATQDTAARGSWRYVTR
jgi:hypothetical protein